MWMVLTLLGAAQGPTWLDPASTTAHAQRIVSLAPSLTEIIFALDKGNTIVGVTRFDQHPPAVRSLPRIGGFVDPNTEAIAALHPDLVVAIPTSGGKKALLPLVGMGIPILALPHQTLADMQQAIQFLARLLGAQAKGHALIEQLQSVLQHTRAAHRQRPPWRAAVVVGRRPLVLAGQGTFLHELLDILNLTNVVSSPNYPTLDLEALASLAPRVIIDVSHEQPDATYWRPISAHVLHQPEALLRPGPRWPPAVMELSRALQAIPPLAHSPGLSHTPP